jgi:hypothetical protein
VLLDTSFILPSLGIGVGEDVAKGLEKLSGMNAEIHYSRFSILESLWVSTRAIQDGTFDHETFWLGLRSILEGTRYKQVAENAYIFNEALEIYRLGHRDMIDNILYAASAHLDLRLLTVDTDLKEFIHAKGLKDTLMSPSDEFPPTENLEGLGKT